MAGMESRCRENSKARPASWAQTIAPAAAKMSIEVTGTSTSETDVGKPRRSGFVPGVGGLRLGYLAY